MMQAHISMAVLIYRSFSINGAFVVSNAKDDLLLVE